LLLLIKNNVLALLAIVIAFYTATVYMHFNTYLMGTIAVVVLICFCAWAYNNELRRQRAAQAQEKISAAGYENSIDVEGGFETIDADSFFRAMSGGLNNIKPSQASDKNNAEPMVNNTPNNELSFADSLTTAQKNAFKRLKLPLEMTTGTAVKQSFHKLVRDYHPDSNANVSHDESVEKIQQLKEARKIVEKCIKCSNLQ
jgi:ABC-type nickel/cobalt efflux system permease component RcnA